MKTKSRVIRVAKVLSKLMSDREDISVTVSGRTAFSCGGRINVPFGDFSDSDYVTMTHGYIDHEIGHEKHTSFSINFKSKLHANLCNIFEDARMEKLVSDEYPGAKINLQNLVLLAMKKGLFAEPSESENPLMLVISYCLYKGRALGAGNTCLDDYAELALSYLSHVYDQNTLEQLTEIVHKITRARSTRDCASMAWEVIELLKSASEEEQQDSESEESGDDSDSEQSDGEQSDGEQSDGEPSGESDGEQSDGEPSGESDGEQSESSSSSNTSTTQDQASTDSQPNSKPNIRAIQEVNEAIEEDSLDLPDFHEEIAKKLGEEAENYMPTQDEVQISNVFSGVLPVTNRCLNLGLPFVNSEMIPSAGKAVYRSLHRVLLDEEEQLNGFRSRGKRLSSKKLVGTALGDDRIFKSPVIENEVKAAISILIDSSGSMGGGPQEIANGVALAMSKGLQSLKVNNEIGFYSSLIGLYIAKSFEQKNVRDERFSVHSDQYTPTGEAMKSALMRIYKQPEEMKCLFVVTDGEPSCNQSYSEAVALANILGVKIVILGVNMYESAIGKLELDGVFVTRIDCISKMKSALSKVVKANIF
ncbi:VWA domain-containing protein [Pseudoalteromonas sp. SK20]|uniref:VWA domain-containing protein n=1 Tax=Pseudoalteromonas sp. SK20 TaxID=1938367 RepID=UPI0009787C0E|nr:VWA domain-containing protein [Pseudoalteromonas sp. SK20]